MAIPVDRLLRYEELTDAVHALVAEHPDLLAVESIGRSHEGRDIWLVTATDAATGPHDEKPAMWVDANIHAIEVTASVSAANLLNRLATGFGSDPTITRALRTRTFYVVPRVNPDGVELTLADHPRHLRSSVRPWPWRDGRQLPGLRMEDVDGDGRVLTMRISDSSGAWTAHHEDPRLMVPVPIEGTDAPRWRLLAEGTIEDYDGFTVPQPSPPEGLDMNRNYPAGWGTEIHGSGDYPGSEPEIAALLRATLDRPNICGFNAYHTSGGVLLRPSSTKSDSDLPVNDVWTWKELGARCTELSGYPVHSVFEDFTWDKHVTMSGASDDWAYEHLGVYSWTTEYWDVIFAATGERSPTNIWYTGPTPEQELAVMRWVDEHAPEMWSDWTPFEHPQLGPVEIGGLDLVRVWHNPPPKRLAAEVAPHADFAVLQALASPCLEVVQLEATAVGDGVWRVRAGIANTGWLPTTVSEWAAQKRLVLPIVAEVIGADEVLGSPARLELGQLAGRSTHRLDGGRRSDATPDRCLAQWLVRSGVGAELTVEARHQRAGVARGTVRLTG
jgi:murein tripeptide amidase MpaA